jgi:hypothetical protein
MPIKYFPNPILDKNGFVFSHSGLKIPLFGDDNEIDSAELRVLLCDNYQPSLSDFCSIMNKYFKVLVNHA